MRTKEESSPNTNISPHKSTIIMIPNNNNNNTKKTVILSPIKVEKITQVAVNVDKRISMENNNRIDQIEEISHNSNNKSNSTHSRRYSLHGQYKSHHEEEEKEQINVIKETKVNDQYTNNQIIISDDQSKKVKNNQFKLNIRKGNIRQRNAQISSSKSFTNELKSCKQRMRKKLDSNQIDEYIRNQRILLLFNNNELLPDHKKNIQKCDLGNNSSESDDMCEI